MLSLLKSQQKFATLEKTDRNFKLKQQMVFRINAKMEKLINLKPESIGKCYKKCFLLL